MNKNVKRIVAMALAIGTVSAVAPATNVNLLTTKAYASSTNETDTLEELKLETSSGSNIKLYSDSGYDSSDKVASDEVEADETYYAKTSSDTINISIDGPSSKYVRVFKGTSSSTKGKKVSSDISLSSDSTTTTIVVKVYGEEPDSSIRYDEDDDYDLLNTYKIKVKYTGSDSSSSDSSSSDLTADDYDSIYLDKLSIDGKSISLSESKINYTYNVDSDVDEVTIKAVPEDEDTETVTIDGDEVDDSDNYKNKVSLDKGKNEIEIDLTNDDDEERVYTLTINRASTSSTSTSTSTTTTTATTPSTETNVVTPNIKANQWVLVNGKWQYNDINGNPLKNRWYYVQADGNMATGWLSINTKWYYFGADGAMKTGWQLVNGTWYYLYPQTGMMAYSTTIDGYKLNANGAWIK